MQQLEWTDRYPEGTHQPLLGLGPTTFSAGSWCQTPGLGLQSQGEGHPVLPSGIVLARRFVQSLRRELTVSHHILSTSFTPWRSQVIPSVHPQSLCTSSPACLSLRFPLLKNSGNAASCRKSSLTAHPVPWPSGLLCDGDTLHTPQDPSPHPVGQTAANSLGLLCQAKCYEKVAGNWKRPEFVPSSQIPGLLCRLLLLPESCSLCVASASILALWAVDGTPFAEVPARAFRSSVPVHGGPFLLLNSQMGLGFRPPRLTSRVPWLQHMSLVGGGLLSTPTEALAGPGWDLGVRTPDFPEPGRERLGLGSAWSPTEVQALVLPIHARVEAIDIPENKASQTKGF